MSVPDDPGGSGLQVSSSVSIPNKSDMETEGSVLDTDASKNIVNSAPKRKRARNNTYANLKCKAISALKRGRPGNQSRDETPTTFTCHGSPAPSNPGTPNCPSKIRKVPATHPDMPLNFLRTDRKDHMPGLPEWLKNRQK
ncbi:hypothetical protein ACJJTC_009622 [Scirpophaga incertulas]